MRIKLKLSLNKLHLNSYTLPFPTAQKLVDAFNAHKMHPFIKDMASVIHLTYANKHVTIRREDAKREDPAIDLALDAKIHRKCVPFIKYDRNTVFKRIEEMRAAREKEMSTVYSGLAAHANLLRSAKGRVGKMYVSLVALMDDKYVKLVYRQGMVEDTYVGGFKWVRSARMQDLKAIFEGFLRMYNWRDVKEYVKGEVKYGEEAMKKTPSVGKAAGDFGELRGAEAPHALTPGLGGSLPGRQAVPVGAYTPSQFSSPGQPAPASIFGAGPAPNYSPAPPGFARVTPSPLKHYDMLESHRSEMLKTLNVEKNEAKRKELYRNLELLEMKRREMFRMADLRRRNYNEPAASQPAETTKKEVKGTGAAQRTRVRVKERGEHGKEKTNHDGRNEPIEQRHGLLVQRSVIMKDGGKSMENEYDEMKKNRRVERGGDVRAGMMSDMRNGVRGGIGVDMRGGMEMRSTDLRSNMEMRGGDLRNSMDMRSADLRGGIEMRTTDLRGGMDMRSADLRSVMDMRGGVDMRNERPDLRNERMEMRSGMEMKNELKMGDMRGEMRNERINDMRITPDGRMYMDMRTMDARMDMRQEGRGTQMRMAPEMFMNNTMENRRRMHTPDVMGNVVDGKNTINPRQVLEGGYAPVRGRPKKKIEEKGAHVPVRGRPRTKPRSPGDQGMFTRSEETRANPQYYAQPRSYTMQPPVGFEMSANPMGYSQPIKTPSAFQHVMKMPTPSNFNLQNVQNYSPDGELNVKKNENDDDKGGFGDEAVDMPDFTG
ncbi:hypothetical protein THOM_0032 [Trachipleistophora hominis]|uniref:Uncharacterized protein n=1 Tax=Trachipleistophora hominis TaxID=72359 RepID=L7JZV3_TRAHO|nr:hypothetical protein THOM_0032 [Trachipleistophora hominis]